MLVGPRIETAAAAADAACRSPPLPLCSEPKIDVAFVALAAVVYGGARCGGAGVLPCPMLPWQGPLALGSGGLHKHMLACRSRILLELLQTQLDPRALPAPLLPPRGAVLYFAIGSAFLPGHPAWATLLLWVSSQIGARPGERPGRGSCRAGRLRAHARRADESQAASA